MALARTALASLLASDAPIDPATGLFMASRIEPLDAFVARAMENHPGLARLEAQRGRAAQAVRAERASWLPTVAAFGMRELHADDLTLVSPTWAVGVAATVTLFDGMQRGHRVGAARSQERKVDLLKDRARRDLAQRRCVGGAAVQLGEDVRLYLPEGKSVEWQELAETYGLTAQFPILRFASRPFLKRLDFAFNAVSHARSEGADLVYTRVPWAALIARARGLKCVLEIHDLPTGRFGPLVYRWYLRHRNPGLTVYITAALKDLADRVPGVQARPGEFAIAPDGVDLARYQQLPNPRQARTALE